MKAIFTVAVRAVLLRASPFLLLAALSLLLAVPLAAAADDGKDVPRGIDWVGYNEALSVGRDFDKPVFIHFTARWCKWCVKMQNETYSDPKVINYMTENFVAVKIDTEQNPALSRKYNVQSVPTLWFLDSAGKGLTSINGYVGPDNFMLVLEFIKTQAYEETDYQTWSRRHPSR